MKGKLLTKEIAEELFENRRIFELDEFTSIDAAAANALASFKSDDLLLYGLILNGLTSLSNEAAKALAMNSEKHETKPIQASGCRTKWE